MTEKKYSKLHHTETQTEDSRKGDEYLFISDAIAIHTKNTSLLKKTLKEAQINSN